MQNTGVNISIVSHLGSVVSFENAEEAALFLWGKNYHEYTIRVDVVLPISVSIDKLEASLESFCQSLSKDFSGHPQAQTVAPTD